MSSTGQGNGIARTVGANIRLARGRMKQRELAAAMATIDGRFTKVTTQRVSDWERGANRPSDPALVRIADVLNRDFAWFFIDHSADEVAA